MVDALIESVVLSGGVTELAEGARLEIVCALTRHRGFESHPLRFSMSLAQAKCPNYGVGLCRVGLCRVGLSRVGPASLPV